MSWSVGITNWPYFSQLSAPAPSDGKPDENSQEDCGETCVSQILSRLGYGSIPPDDLKDELLGQGVTGPSSAQMLQNALGWFYVPSVYWTPTVMQNGKDGLLDRVWQYLYKQQPLIGLFEWIDDAGTVYPAILHWRVYVALTDKQATTSDPWTGQPRIEDWTTNWARFKGQLIGVQQECR